MSVYIPAELRRRVAEHFSRCCAYCRTAEWLSVATFEIEHVVPRSAGGATVFENLCFSCPTCNRHKSDRSVATDPESGTVVELFHPHRHVWRDHFNWTGDASQLVGRTPLGRATIDALRINRPQLVRVRRMWVAMGEHPPNMR